MKLILFPNEILTTKCEPVKPEEFGAELKRTLIQMRTLMQSLGGAGLAAPQVGILKRFFVVGSEFYVNPEIEVNGHPELNMEGCLSIPDFRAKIMRMSNVVVRAQDAYGKAIKHYLQGPKAFAVQHEYDHLNGILINRHVQAKAEAESAT